MELNIKQISWRVSLHWKRGSEYCVLLSATKVLINSGDTKGLGTIAISLFVVPHGARRQYISLAKGLGMKFFINQKFFFGIIKSENLASHQDGKFDFLCWNEIVG